MKIGFICMIIKNHFHKKGFALGLVLKQRLAASRKWSSAISARGFTILEINRASQTEIREMPEVKGEQVKSCNLAYLFCYVRNE